MLSYEQALEAASQLPEQDRLRLIDALWETVTPDAEAVFSAEWIEVINSRVADLESGRAKTVPWPQIREEALARLKDDRNN